MDVVTPAVHIPSTSAGNSGISRGRFRASSWIRRLWRHRPGRYISSCPKGQVRTARPHRGAILGTVPGAGFDGRKAVERGARAERNDSGLVRSRCETTGGPPTSSFGRFRVRRRFSHSPLRLLSSSALGPRRGPSGDRGCGRAASSDPRTSLAGRSVQLTDRKAAGRRSSCERTGIAGRTVPRVDQWRRRANVGP